MRASSILAAVGMAAFFAACPSASSLHGFCDGVQCGDGFTCEATTGQCSAVSPCATVTCKADEHCVVDAGAKVGRCAGPCDGIVCGIGQKCDATTGACKAIDPTNLCAERKCDAGKSCNPQNGLCESVGNCNACCDAGRYCNLASGKCELDQCAANGPGNVPQFCQCGPDTACEQATGKCLPSGGVCGAPCGEGKVCDVDTRRCIALPAGQASPGEIGSPCAKSSDCSKVGSSPFCIGDTFFTALATNGGYCSASCDEGGCASGAACVDFGIKLCLDLCLLDDDCRDGYSCTSVSTGDARRFCFPKRSPSSCTGAGCSPIGGTCSHDADCVAGASCLTQFPGGYCMAFDCSGFGAGCPGGAPCVQLDYCGLSFGCLSTCDATISVSCRPGYACYGTTSGVCYPGCRKDTECTRASCTIPTYCDPVANRCEQPCAQDKDCGGSRVCDKGTGRCYTACLSNDACNGHGVCDTTKRRCLPPCVADEECPATSFCGPSGLCEPRCVNDGDCGSGKYCGLAGHCHPNCATASDCGSNERCDLATSHCVLKCTRLDDCGAGFTCDINTGTCRRDFSAVNIGAACAHDSDCGPGGICAIGAGNPGGYCTASPCGATAQCPVGSVCENMSGSAQCMKRCDPNGTDCRAGYLCKSTNGDTICSN